MKFSFKPNTLKISVDHTTKQKMANAIRMNMLRQGLHVETLANIDFDSIVHDVLDELPGKV